MGAGLMIGTFAAPAAAVADSVTIDKAGGVRSETDYRDELHGQVCDFYFNYGDNFNNTYANEGVFINGTFSGPNAAEMELVDVTLVDLPATSDNDLLELDWVDFNRFDRAGVDSSGGINNTEDAEMEECSSDHDFEVFMADDQTTDSEFSYWDVPGTYTYRLSFANSFGGNGTVTLTQDVVITVAGDVAEIDLQLNGDQSSVTWPVETEYFSPFNDNGDYVTASFQFLDADGNVTHPLYSEEEKTPDVDFYYDEYDGNETGEIYQGDFLDADWSEEVWIMSNDWDTGDYMIHDEESSAAWYSWEHDDQYEYGFNYTSAYFWLPTAEDGEDVWGSVVNEDGSRDASPFSDEDDYYGDYWQWSDDYLGGDEIALKHGLVDYKGDFTGGIEIEFYVGSDVAEVSNFWVRLAEGDDGAPVDSDTVSIDFRDWVDPDTLGENTNIVAKTGVAVPGELFDCHWTNNNCNDAADLPNDDDYYYDFGFVRKDQTSFQTTYVGGVDEDGNPLNAGKFIWVDSNDFTLTYSVAKTSYAGGDLMLTDANGNVTVTAAVPSTKAAGSYNVEFVSLGDADDWDWYGYGYSNAEIGLEEAGFWPQYELQNASSFAQVQPYSYRPTYEWWTELHKSVLLESTQTMTFKATDIWGTPIAGMGSYLNVDCWDDPLWCAEFAEFDDFEVTNASGLVTYTVENIDDPADVVDRHEGQDDCDNITNCQEQLADVQGDSSDYYTTASFDVYPSEDYISDFYDESYSSDYVVYQFVRSTQVDDLVGEIYRDDLGYEDMDAYVGTGDNAIQVDTEGDEREDMYWWAVPLNADGVALAGVGSYSITATDGGYVNTLCDDQGLYEWAFWCWDGLDLYLWDDGGDELQDVSQFTESVSGSANPRGIEVVVTGTLVGTTTYTMTVAGYSESFDQEYFNTVSDARYIAAVATDAANVIAGNIATATFKVTDRFGNAVEDVDVVFSENGLGEFLSNDPAATTGVTDANGLTSVDLLTPANSMGSSAVTAEFETLQNPAAYAPFGITAAVESANANVSWTHITPTITVKALKYRAGIKVFVKNATGNITRVFVDGKMKRVFVPATVNGFEKILLKKGGKRTVVVTVASPLGNIFETFELKIKKNKK
jgi:hypothetical protein